MENVTHVTCYKGEIKELKQSASNRQSRLISHWKQIGSVYSFESQIKISRKYRLNPTHPKRSTLNLDRLEELYFQVCGSLNQKYALVLSRTPLEIKISEFFNRNHIVHENQKWIGNRCVDLFLPWVGGENFNSKRKLFGLSIEVNGEVHNQLIKMIKDESLGDYLQEISIGVQSIHNSDSKLMTVLSEIKALSEHCAKLDFRAIRRVKYRVYLETILHHASDHEFSSIFQSNYEAQDEGL